MSITIDKVKNIQKGISFITWMKEIFVDDPYWKVVPCDIMRQERTALYRDDLIQIGHLKYSRIQWIAYTLGVLVSGCYYEIRFKDYYKPKTSARLVFSPNLKSFIEWINTNWIKLTYTESDDRYSIDFLTLSNEMEFIDPEWWTSDERKKMVFHRFAPYGKEDEKAKQNYDEAKGKIIAYFEEIFGDIDKKEFACFFQKGVDCLPIDIPENKVVKTTWGNLRSRGRVRKFISGHMPEMNSSRYEESIFLSILDRCRRYPFHDIKNSGYYRYILIDNMMFRSLDRAVYPYIAIEIAKQGEANKQAFTNNDRRSIFERHGFKVFNDNHCFYEEEFRASEIYVVDNFCRGLYKTDSRWMDTYGGEKRIKRFISQYDLKFLDKEFNYRKNHTIEMNHFPMKNTIINLRNPGYPKYDRHLAMPLYTADHAKLTKCSNEKEQLEMFIDNRWISMDEAEVFCEEKIQRVLKIEKERELGRELSALLKSQFSIVLNRKITACLNT